MGRQADAERFDLVLCEAQVAGERRSVHATVGASEVGVMERSAGPDTEAAYGAAVHGHKLLVDRGALGDCLGVGGDEVARALREFFRPASGGDVLLSDLMDALDVAGVRYTYLAWTGDGDAVLRPDGHR